MRNFSWLLIFCCLLVGCQENNEEVSAKQEIIYYGGEILTMVGEEPDYPESVVVEDELIVFVGDYAEAEKLYPSAASVDLKGQTLLPGFIDGHAHFASFSVQAIGAQILPPPDAGASNISLLIDILKAWNTPENREMTGWIFGLGFDDSVLEENRFPTRHDLDQVTTEYPIMIIHISGHFAAVNSKGLEVLGISSETKDPEGGIIRREPDSDEPNGVLEELAAIPHMLKAMSPANAAAGEKFFQAGQQLALSYGYTTAQEGRAMGNHETLAKAAENNALKLDVVSYVDYAFVDKYMDSKWNSMDYLNHYRIGGMKVTLDGSPQGRTAWRTIPYLLPPDGADDDYAGYPAIPKDEDVVAIYEKGFKNNWQILTHTNGDAAVDQMIRTMKPVSERYGNENRRNVMVHGQYVREDQLDALMEMDVIVSLFPLHTFYWGDWHKRIIGDELGNKISPTRTALNKGLALTIHSDAPVALPNLMRVVWTAVSRTSRSGAVIGEGERLTPYEAMQAITTWSAHQHFEEDRKGSIAVGKWADLVILNANPLSVPVDQIKDIVVMETIKEGVSVYQRR